MMQNTNDCVVEMDRWSSINSIQNWSSTMISIVSFLITYLSNSKDQSESLFLFTHSFLNPHLS